MDQIAIRLKKTNVNEGDSFGVDVTFVDRDGEAKEAPTTVDYQIYDLTTHRVVRDWTSAQVGESSSIEITSSDNALQSRANKYERRQLTVRADRGDDSQVSGQVRWWIKNQGFLP